jgi:hypothetical protein
MPIAALRRGHQPGQPLFQVVRHGGAFIVHIMPAT